MAKTDFELLKIKDAAVQVETLDGDVIGLEMNLNLRTSLSLSDLKAMGAMVDLAAGKKTDFNYSKACQNDEPGNPQNVGKIKGFLFQVSCYRFPATVDGQWEYTLKAWLPG